MKTLKAFHIVFITCSTILSFFFGVWCLQAHLASPNLIYALLGLLGIVMSLGLIVYGIYFLQKMKKEGI